VNTSAAWAKRVEVPHLLALPPLKHLKKIWLTVVDFSTFLHVFLAEDSICLVRYMLSPVRPSVCLSVCHTGGSVKKVEVRIMTFHLTVAPSV